MSSPPNVLRFLITTAFAMTIALPDSARLVARQPAEALDLVLVGLAPYFEQLQAATMSPNVALFVGQGNGRVTIAQGAHTGVRAGRVLRGPGGR